MQFFFFSTADTPLFVRDDAESAVWSVDQLSVTLMFPYVSGKEVERGMRVGFFDFDGVFQVFEVRKAKTYEPDHYQEITAEHIAISELTDAIYEGDDITDETAEDALEPMLDGTGWQVGNVTADNTSSLNLSIGDVWNNTRSIEQNWNVLILPRVTVDATGITGRYLDIVPNVGTWRGVRLSLEKNADNVGVTYDDTDVKTALYAYGRETDKVKLTFADEVWEATEDHPAKPDGQTYLEDPTAKALYGRNGQNRFGFYQNGDIDDAEVLLEKTWETLQTMNAPKITVDCTLADLHRLGYADQDIRLHDKVVVELRALNRTITLDVIKLDVDLLDPTKTRPTIGAYIPNIIYINRETAANASGRYGKNAGDTAAEYQRMEFETSIAYNAQQIRLRAYQTDLERTDADVKRAFAELSLDATKISSLVTGSGVMLDQDGELVVDQQGNPVFTTNGSGLYSKITQNKDQIDSIVVQSGVHGNASKFLPTVHYNDGAYVIYNNKIWQFTDDHFGPWTGTDVTEIMSTTDQLAATNTRITQTESDISLVVTGTTGNRRVNTASILLAINADGSTSAGINADKIILTGNTTLAGKVDVLGSMYVDQGALIVNGGMSVTGLEVYNTMTCEGINCTSIDVDEGTITGVTSITAGSVIIPALPNNITIGSSNAGGIIDSFSAVDNQDNTYTITWTTLGNSTPQSLTFSRASVPTITGAWDGSGVYQVSADGTVVLSTTPSMMLNGAGAASFSAELLSDAQSPVVQSNKIYGYLQTAGSTDTTTANVYSQRSGSGTAQDPYTYSGIVATLNVGSLYTDGFNAVNVNNMYRVTPVDEHDELTTNTVRVVASNGATNNYSVNLTKTTYVDGNNQTRNCVELKSGIGNVLAGRIDTQSVYNDGISSVTVSSVTAPTIGATTTTASITVTATASNSATKTATLALSSTTYSPTQGANDHCVEISIGGNVVGRFDTENLYSTGWAAAYGKVSWPSADSGTSFYVHAPSSVVGSDTYKQFTLSQSGAYVYCNDGTNNVAAKSFYGSITAANPISAQPSGSSLRTVTVGTGGNRTYVRINATGYRNQDDYITIVY